MTPAAAAAVAAGACLSIANDFPCSSYGYMIVQPTAHAPCLLAHAIWQTSEEVEVEIAHRDSNLIDWGLEVRYMRIKSSPRKETISGNIQCAELNRAHDSLL